MSPETATTGAKTWWAKPQLRTDEDAGKERKTSWLELFYDLVFVVVVGALSQYLAHHPNPMGVASFVLMFLPACWLWVSGTFYTERFEVEDVSHRVFTFLQMFPVAALAVFARAGTGATSQAFALSYVAGRLIIVVLWFRAGLYDRRAKPMTDRFTIGFSLSIALFTLSVFVAPPLRFILWIAGLAADFLTPWLTRRQQSLLPKFSSSRLPERFGLFVLIVLGENVVSVINGVAVNPQLGLRIFVMAALGMVLAFGFWWMYFDLVNRRQPRPGFMPALLRNYLHLPLIIAITASAAGILNLLSAEPSPAVRWLLCGSMAVVLASLAVLHMVLRKSPNARDEGQLRTLLWCAAAASLVVGLFSRNLGAVALLALLAGIQLVLILFAVVSWARGRLT